MCDRLFNLWISPHQIVWTSSLCASSNPMISLERYWKKHTIFIIVLKYPRISDHPIINKSLSRGGWGNDIHENRLQELTAHNKTIFSNIQKYRFDVFCVLANWASCYSHRQIADVNVNIFYFYTKLFMHTSNGFRNC